MKGRALMYKVAVNIPMVYVLVCDFGLVGVKYNLLKMKVKALANMR